MQLDGRSSQVTVLTTVAYHKDPGIQLANKLKVKLTMQQYTLARNQACYVLAQPSFQRLKHHTKTDHRKAVILGNLAEVAASIATGICSDVGDYNEGDLAGGIEVRHTELSHGGLLVRPTDKLHRPFIFVTGEGLDYICHGWQVGDNVTVLGKQLGDEKHPCWVLDRDSLLPMDGLIMEYHRQNMLTR